MKRAARQVALCAAALLLFCIACRLFLFRDFALIVPLQSPQEAEMRQGGLRIEADRPDAAALGEAEVRPGYLRVPIRPRDQGELVLTLLDSSGEPQSVSVLRIGPLGTVYDLSTGGFTGDSAVMIAVSLFFLAVSAIMLWNYRQARGPAYCAYSTIYFAGFAIFSLATGLMITQITVGHILHPEEISMLSAYQYINGASKEFMLLTAPLVVLFALAMCVSNIVLLRHARLKLQNVLGLLISLLLIGGEALGLYLFWRPFAGSEWEWRLTSTAENVYATVFVYFECMLAGSVICGVRAAHRRTDMDKNCIVILGCWFRPDGSLPPLLKGRVDRAVAFWREQRKATGREAILIPAGGQGTDDPMPEAEAMRRYLLEQGIPERLILPETLSRSTYENMANARAIIRSACPGAKVLYATTSYHVFRSGIWAAEAGLEAEGIGAKTRWWYWPNAFMRECAGLLARRWKQELLFLVLLIAFFALLTMVL